MKMLLLGPYANENLHDDRTTEKEKLLKLSTHFISPNMKTYHQSMNHCEKCSKDFCLKMGTPFNVGVGLHFYNSARSKKLVNFLSDFDISDNYQKGMEIAEERTKQQMSLYPLMSRKII